MTSVSRPGKETVKKSVQLIQSTFPIVVGSLASPSVDHVCQKNNLNFVELIRPFCELDNLDYRLKDPSGSDHNVSHLHLNVQDVNESPPPPPLARRYLNDAVYNSQNEVTRAVPTGLKGNAATVDIPDSCPWYQAWSETFFRVQFPSDHEFTKHLIGCLLVTSSSDPPDTLQGLLQTLQQMQLHPPSRLPKWFSSEIFKYYVLVHDASDADKEKALNFFNSLKTAYGSENCFFLEINSHKMLDPSPVYNDYWSKVICRGNFNFEETGSGPRTPVESAFMPKTHGSINDDDGTSPVYIGEASDVLDTAHLHPLSLHVQNNHFAVPIEYPEDQQKCDIQVVNSNVWSESVPGGRQLGLRLSASDIESIKSMIRHLVLQTLLPHIEKHIFLLNDFVTNKRGVSRSLLSATKRLFGSTKSGPPSSNSVVYAADAPELQHRRLADLYFLCTAYHQAFQAYHGAKRDFSGDQAWPFYAGALEMAALSAFLTSESPKKALEYSEEAILTYSNSCKMPQFATRATLLSTECLKEREMFGEASRQYIRMTSEDTDLRSAVLLEQAAYCFLQSQKPRKYAFHIILAGHRYSKAGQKRHALRCYNQGYQIIDGTHWNLLEEQILLLTGRAASSLKVPREASSAFYRLLTSYGSPRCSKQSVEQQTNHLLEFLNTYELWIKEEPQKALRRLPLPILEMNSAKVLTIPSDEGAFEADLAGDSTFWERMEELIAAETPNPPLIFKPSIWLFSEHTTNNLGPVVAVNERIRVQVRWQNPLDVPLPVSQLRLLWTFTAADGTSVDNESPTSMSESLVSTQIVSVSILPPSSHSHMVLAIVPLCAGTIIVTGVAFTLSCTTSNSSSPCVSGKQEIVVRGRKLKPRKERPYTVTYADDRRLLLTIVPSAPLLTISTDVLNERVLSGELEMMSICLTNEGNAPISGLYLASNYSGILCLPSDLVTHRKIVRDNNNTDDSSNNVVIITVNLSSVNGVLLPCQKMILPFWFQAPHVKGDYNLNIVFYYLNGLPEKNIRYRVTRFTRNLSVFESVSISAAGSVSAMNPPISANVTNMVNLSVSLENKNVEGVIIHLKRIDAASHSWVLLKNCHLPPDASLKTNETTYFLLKSGRVSNVNWNVSDIVISELSQTHHRSLTFIREYLDGLKLKSKTSDLFLCLTWEADIEEGEKRSALGFSLVQISQWGMTVAWPVPRSITEKKPSFQIVKRPREKLKKNVEKLEETLNISYTVNHQDIIRHSFSDSSICPVPLAIILRNPHTQPLQIQITTTSSGSTALTPNLQVYSPHSASAFSWIGRSLIEQTVAGGGGECDVQMTAAVTSYGVYDIAGRVRVWVRRGEEDGWLEVKGGGGRGGVIVCPR